MYLDLFNRTNADLNASAEDKLAALESLKRAVQLELTVARDGESEAALLKKSIELGTVD
jgi:hypothetical protein